MYLPTYLVIQLFLSVFFSYEYLCFKELYSFTYMMYTNILSKWGNAFLHFSTSWYLAVLTVTADPYSEHFSRTVLYFRELEQPAKYLEG